MERVFHSLMGVRVPPTLHGRSNVSYSFSGISPQNLTVDALLHANQSFPYYILKMKKTLSRQLIS